MDWWTGGLVDWWTGGLVEWWNGGLTDWQTEACIRGNPTIGVGPAKKKI